MDESREGTPWKGPIPLSMFFKDEERSIPFSSWQSIRHIQEISLEAAAAASAESAVSSLTSGSVPRPRSSWAALGAASGCPGLMGGR